MTVGVIVVLAVLVLGSGIGLWHRRVDGRLRPAGSSPASSVGSGPAPSLAPTEPGPARSVVPVEPGPAVPVESGPASPAATERIDPALLAELGVEPARATLLQFSSAFCAPCRAVRRISGEVAAMVPGVRHVEVDAESHLDAVRALGIWRTPTLLVLDADGRITRRATGVPGKPQLIAALGEVLAGGSAPGR